jgi:hypothetical protein
MEREKLVNLQASPVEIVRGNRGVFRDGFADWLETPEGKGIWAEFEESALKIARKRSHWSARTIIEYLRHMSALRDAGAYKINNCIAPDCARLFMLIHPEYVGFFELREQDERRLRKARVEARAAADDRFQVAA